MSFITAIGTAVPANKFDQAIISSFMERLAIDDARRKKIKTVFRATGIRTRYSVLGDYGKENGYTFFANSKDAEPFPGTASRMQAYRQHAAPLSMQAIADCRLHSHFEYSAITHLITVSCTGMYAPGLDIDLINQLPLQSSVSRTCINFMGCYAAINALKSADAFCQANPEAKVLIVCTELCSLHFQKDFSDDNILANALFSDGAAALLVEAKPSAKISLHIEGFHNDILSHDSEHMAWTIGNLGFEMKLSAYVPDVLGRAIKPFVSSLMKKINTAPSDIDYYAVHPGGKKILDCISNELVISKEKLRESYDVLHNYGNMSSPTVLFVLKAILEGNNVKHHDRILSLAFGPGITLESLLLKVERA
jgi:predicted naringenin-chalcone synthase